jgi:integrase
MNTEQIFVFGLVEPPPGTPKEKRRYRVRWRYAGRDRKRSFRTKTEAERFRTELQHAVIEGERFDAHTGLPVVWSTSPLTWFTWSREWLDLKWPGWSGNSRRSGVESLVAIVPYMVAAQAVDPPATVGGWLREVGFAHGVDIDEASVEAKWVSRWSSPLSEIDPRMIERALTGATTKRDGKQASTEVVRRRRTALNAVLKMALKRGHLESNPMDKVEWKVPQRTIAVDITTVASFLDIKQLVDFTMATPTASARYGALFACVGLAGLRPSEAMGLRVGDVTLPKAGWGGVVLRGATTAPGERFSDGPGAHEDKELKQRAVGSVRSVPIPPLLVDYMRRHMRRFPPVGDRIFTTSSGKPMSSTSYSQAWKRARFNQWPADTAFAKVTLYDLRHSAATLMLRSGVVPAEVARRLGHSVDVLMRTYAGVLDDELDRSNALIESELERQLSSPSTD